MTVPGDRPINVRLWYPATVGPDQRRGVTDAFAIRAVGALGPVTIATSPGDAVRNAPFDLSEGPYPVVLLSPGFALTSSTYAWLAEHLASRGFVVLSPDHDEVLDPGQLWRSTVTRPREISSVLDFAEAQAGPSGAWTGLVDTGRSAVLGHSYGGYAAQVSAGARLDTTGFTRECHDLETTDPRTFLCEALLPHLSEMARAAGLDEVPRGLWPSWSDAPTPGGRLTRRRRCSLRPARTRELDVPVLAVGGTADQDTPYAAGARATFDRTGSTRQGGGRTSRCRALRVRRSLPVGPARRASRAQQFCTDPGWERAQAHDVVKHYVTAFLLAELRDDAAAASELRVRSPFTVT